LDLLDILQGEVRLCAVVSVFGSLAFDVLENVLRLTILAERYDHLAQCASDHFATTLAGVFSNGTDGDIIWETCRTLVGKYKELHLET
jgi:hypothetical protein